MKHLNHYLEGFKVFFSHSNENKLLLIFVMIFGINYSSFSQTTFAIIGDFGSNNSNEASVRNLVYSWNPSFIITVGDNVYSTNSSAYNNDVGQYYHQYIFPNDPVYGISSDPSINKFWPAVGNHDWDAGNLSYYLSYFELPHNERYYTKTFGNTEFFFIDSDTREPDGVSDGSVQYNWIKNQIQNSTATWKIVVFHHPAYCSGHNNTYMQWPFEDWGVNAVFTGHVHIYERIIKDDNNDGNNITYIVNGIGGKSLGGLSSTIEEGSQIRYNSDYGALKVIENSLSLQFQLYSKDNVLRDSYDITSPTPVELTAFNGNYNGTNVKLFWETATEIKNYGFEVERSFDKDNWVKIGFVYGNGNSNISHNYTYFDNDLNLSGTYYYRLKQIDNDGSFKYYDAINIDVLSPGKFNLSQNYPNPFNPSSTIEYSIPADGFVSLKVFDVLGREVSTIFNEEQKSGFYKVQFNASNLASGVYFYRLIVKPDNSSAQVFTQTKSFVVEK